MPATVTSLKLDPAIKERVQRLASARRRTPHWILREAVEQYVERIASAQHPLVGEHL